MIVVSDTGPLNYLTLIGQVYELPKLYLSSELADQVIAYVRSALAGR